MIIQAIIVLVSGIIFSLVILALRKAPEGREDKYGFKFTGIAKTERKRATAVPQSREKRAEVSEGPEWDGYKPLMRNRRAMTPSPTGTLPATPLL